MQPTTATEAKVPEKMEDFCKKESHQIFVISDILRIHFVKSTINSPEYWFYFHEDVFALVEPYEIDIIHKHSLDAFFKESVIEPYEWNMRSKKSAEEKPLFSNVVECEATTTGADSDDDGFIVSDL